MQIKYCKKIVEIKQTNDTSNICDIYPPLTNPTTQTLKFFKKLKRFAGDPKWVILTKYEE